MRQGFGFLWLAVWVVQIVLELAVSLILVFIALQLPMPAAGWVFGTVMWGVLPLLGALTAYLATRRGLNNYVSWLAPPAAQWAGVMLLTGFPPEMGPVFTCALVALVGAAAGYEVNRRQERDEKTE